MNPKAFALVGAVVLLLGGGAYFYTNGGLNGAPTGNMVKDAYELARNSDLEVMKVEDEGSLDKVTLRDGDEVFDAYVTDDGKYLVNNPVLLENYTKTLEARNEFVSCLEDENARFYGIMSQENSQLQNHTRMAQLQIQVLGGANGLQNLFYGPGTEGFPQQQVVQNGLVWRLNGEFSSGVKTLQELEEATGCTYEGPGA